MTRRNAAARAGLLLGLLCACAGEGPDAASKPGAVPVHEAVVARALAGCAPSAIPLVGAMAAPEPPPAPEGAEEYLEAALSAYSGNDLRTRELALADLAQAGEGMVASFAAVVARAEQSPERAAAAISALGAMGGPLARDALCRALETHATPWVRARCAFELGRARDPRLVGRLLLRLKYEVDGESVMWIADALARQGNLAGLEGLLVVASRKDDAWLGDTARAMADELAVARGAPFGGELLRRHANGLVPDAAVDDAQACLAWTLVQRLAQFDLRQVDDARFVLARLDDSVVPLLARSLRDEDRYIRLHAAQCLERRGPRARAAIPALVDALRDPSVAAVAAAALAATADASVAAPLARGFEEGARHETRVACVAALERLCAAPPLDAGGARLDHAAWRARLDMEVGGWAAKFSALHARADAPLDLRQAAAQALVAGDAGHSAWGFLCDLATRSDGDPDTALRALRESLERRSELGEIEAATALERWRALAPARGTIETMQEATARRAGQAALARAAPPPA
ncbi:MAG: HEAT repeat domain-containing protein [Planctomycetia bacterium]